MKTLFTLRHAKSSWDNPDADDFERPLNERGRRAAVRIGREMVARAMRFDRAIASPAIRVRETLDGIAKSYKLPDVRFERSVYAAEPEELLALIHGVDEEAQSLLLVGHNPGLHELALGMTASDPDGLRDGVVAKYPTAALAQIDFPAARWSKVTAGSGRIVALILPKKGD